MMRAWIPTLIFVSLAIGLAWATGEPRTARGSLWLGGTGRNDLDRVKIRVDSQGRGPQPATDVGASDFTIEFWVKGTVADNRAAAISAGPSDGWIEGNILLDRDRFVGGRDYGVSFGAGRVAFGVANGTGQSRTVVGRTVVLDGRWRHVAVQRRFVDGRLTVWVDGRLDALAQGPLGDISYPDNAPPSQPGGGFCQGPGGSWGGACLADPMLVIGAEKHDAGPRYPSFRGQIDELRLSRTLRYRANFARPGTPFVPDPDTVGLYSFDEGRGTVANDRSTVGPVRAPGLLRVWNGRPAWRSDSPFGS